jgi:hypothetical protein
MAREGGERFTKTMDGLTGINEVVIFVPFREGG